VVAEKISVVIPAYNAEATIGKCLEALSKQTLPPVEVLVVDDSSTDQTAAIAAQWSVVIKNARGRGPGAARNTGAFAAKGDIIAFTDSDCIPPPTWLENIGIAFSDPSVGAVGGGYSSGVDDGFWQVYCCEELAYRRRHRNGSVATLVSNNMACKKSVFLAQGGFPEQYPVCEDMLLSYNIARHHKVLWLKDNGVRHHFKNSLSAYIKHQYYFGAESTRFFIDNPQLAVEGSHQGRALHVCIALALFLSVCLFASLPAGLLGHSALALGLFLAGLTGILTHCLLYIPFLQKLSGKTGQSVIKMYGVSLLRDICCGVSFVDGVVRAWSYKRHN
jgi:glycosyltransferase involved in cell wall biosynthesis